MRELRTLLREREIQLQQVDASRGWARGTLSQMVNGHVDMKLKHLFDVLEAAGVAPLDFFCRLCDRPAQAGMDEVLRRLQALEDQREKRA